MSDKISRDGDSIVIEHSYSDEIICTLELTERERDLVEFLLAKRFNELRKAGDNTWHIDDVRRVLTKINPYNAETYADKPGDTR